MDDVRVFNLAQEMGFGLRHLVDSRLARLEHDLDGDRRRRRVALRKRAHDSAEAAGADLGERPLVTHNIHVAKLPRRGARLEEAQRSAPLLARLAAVIGRAPERAEQRQATAPLVRAGVCHRGKGINGMEWKVYDALWQKKYYSVTWLYAISNSDHTMW